MIVTSFRAALRVCRIRLLKVLCFVVFACKCLLTTRVHLDHITIALADLKFTWSLIWLTGDQIPLCLALIIWICISTCPTANSSRCCCSARSRTLLINKIVWIFSVWPPYLLLMFQNSSSLSLHHLFLRSQKYPKWCNLFSSLLFSASPDLLCCWRHQWRSWNYAEYCLVVRRLSRRSFPFDRNQVWDLIPDLHLLFNPKYGHW